MKLAVYSPVLADGMYAEPNVAKKHASAIGITAVDVFGYELEKIPLCEYQKQYNEYGIEICGIVQGAFFSDKDVMVRKKETDKLKALVDDVSKNGIEHIMVVPEIRKKGAVSQVKSMQDKLFVRDTMVSSLNEIVSYAKDSKVTITIENYSQYAYPYSSIAEVRYIMQNVPGIKYTMDIGNFYCVKEDVLEAYRELKGFLQNAHIKDWVFDPFGYCVRPEIPALNGCVMGDGILPLRELLSLMKQDNFDGELLLEINTVDVTKQGLEDSLAFVNKVWGD